MLAADAPSYDVPRARTLGGGALVLVPLVIGAVAYAPILGSYFFRDDFLNFYHLRNYPLLRFLLTIHAGHSCLTRNLIWWGLDRAVGTRPEVFFATVLATHLFVIALLFGVLRTLTGSARVACLGATLWGSAPVQAGSLGWYAVYGQVLVAAIAAWFLYRIVTLPADARPGTGTMVRWALLLVAATTSFGVGIGVAMVLPVIAWLLLPASPTRRRVVGILGVLAVVCPLLYGALVQLYEQLYGFEMGLAVIYIGPRMPGTVVELTGLLLGRGVIDLFAGPLAAGIDLASPAGIGLVATFGLLLAVVLARGSARERRVILAGLGFAIACYGPIAAGRAVFFVRGVRYDQVERFQYAATLGLTIAAAVVLRHLTARLRIREGPKTALTIALAGLLLAVNLRTNVAMDLHDGARVEVATALTAIRGAIHATPVGGDVYIQNQPFNEVGALIGRRTDLFPGWAAIFLIFFPDNEVEGRRVYFVEKPAAVVDLQDGRRTPSLMITPEARHARAGRTAG